MGEAEGLGQQDRVRVGASPDLTKHSQDRRVLTLAVVGFRCQPGSDPKRERAVRRKQGKDALKAGF